MNWQHHPLQLALVHLAVRDGDRGLGDERAEVAGHEVDVLDPVVDEEHLPAAAELALDGLADDVVVVAGDVGAHRQAVDRRRLDHAQIADAHQRHLQRARDGRGGQRHDVDQRAQVLDLLLVAHAEAVLLVDHQQAEVLELDVGLQQPVRADDDVDLAGPQPAQHLALLRRRSESATASRRAPGTPRSGAGTW